MSKGILNDVTKCIGCLKCVSACKIEHHLDDDVPRIWQKNDGLSADNWTSVIQKPGNHFVRKQCRHCIDPACVSVCPVGALQKAKIGAIVYDSSKCMGCRYCMMACPFGIPRYEWDKAVPYIQKCILCYDRIKNGGQPACTTACSNGATIFGEREELLKLAHKMIKENPEKYIGKVWGEEEFGGTSVLYISDIDLSFLSYQSKTGKKPLPKTTVPAMESVPFTFVGMGGAMLGLNWIIRRRMKLSKEQNEKKRTVDE